jgi:hypothetical protein
MKKLFLAVLGLILAVSMGSPLLAQDGTPVPAPPDLGGTAPPAMPDLNQIDLPPPPAPSAASPAPTTSIEEAPVPAVTAATLKAMPTETPVPAEPTPTVKISAPPMVPTVARAPAAPTAESAQSSAPMGSAAIVGLTGTVADYFPWIEGHSLSYEYLKPAAGATAKKTHLVECMEDQTMANGTVHFTLKTTDGDQVVQDKYSLYDNKVEHTYAGKMVLSGHIVLQLPAAGQSVEWQLKGGDGLTHAYKAFFGKAQVYQKVYPDCVIVIDKAMQGTKTVSSRFNYYAKGIGLVAVETYAPGMKLIQTESLALVESGQ